ncbi:MAG: universal stress protein [Acidobacteriaceae bacterium]|nr:universal stress protein [Acidobacteriaceae bacterium]
MFKFRRILFPVDFSEASKNTASYVAWIAREFRSEVTLLHVFDFYEGFSYGLVPDSGAYHAFRNSIRVSRQSEIDKFASGVFDHLPVARTVELGDPAQCIARTAEREGAGLIMMATHGMGTFRWLLLGSITAKVLHDSPCPVWTTVHSDALHSAPRGVASILCALDFYAEPVRVIEAASELADAFGASVHLVHAIAAEAQPGREVDPELGRFLHGTAVAKIAECQRQAHSEWEVTVQSGTVRSVIRETASRYQADMVVIGRGHLAENFGRLRSHTAAIIRESRCPVLSV